VLSILGQSVSDFTVWVLDNASGDETGDVASDLMRMDARVRYHRHPHNIGSLPNMIAGIERVTTPYFSILCDDDVLMPDFFATALAAHRRNEDMAFVSTRVVVVDCDGRFAAPWTDDSQGFIRSPEGAARCLRAGRSMPGVLYRTSAIRTIGPPRSSWWNWTESGWNALAAMRFDVAFDRDIGAIVYVHPESASKRMDTVEFRVSWFRMFEELSRTAMRESVNRRWWNRRVMPLAYARLIGSVVRLCNDEGAPQYGELARLAVASGVNAWFVRSAVGAGRLAVALGCGPLLSVLFTRTSDRAGECATGDGVGPGDSGLAAASLVLGDLNRRAGVSVPC
jgi:glycosyltransferase involved in cell wall biosynthesis